MNVSSDSLPACKRIRGRSVARAGWKATFAVLLMVLAGQGLAQESLDGRSIDDLIRDTVSHVGREQTDRRTRFVSPEAWAEAHPTLAPADTDDSVVTETPMDTALRTPSPRVFFLSEGAPAGRVGLGTESTASRSGAEPADAVGAPSSVETVDGEREEQPAPLVAVGAGSPVFPEGIQYVLQGQSHLAYLSNPYRLSAGSASDIRSDLAWHKEMRLALIVPLLSERTVAYGAASLADVSYQDQSRLDHQPHHLSAGVRLRAGDLLQARIDASDRKRLYRYLSRSWPERDLVSTREWSASAGVRITEALTLPEVEYRQRQVRYERLATQQLYDHDAQTLRVYGNLAGVDDAFIRVGAAYTKLDYLQRPASLVALVGDRYDEQEAFVQWRWRHSVKTVIDGRAGWRVRRYPDLPQRDLSQAFLDLNLGWTYSPKTQFWLNLWNLPYASEESPFYLYSTLRGIRGSVQWTHSPYVWTSMNVVREMQINHPVNPTGRDAFHSWRLGPRFEWQFHRNVKLFADAWYERIFKGTQGQNLRSHVMRVGLVINLDNGNPGTRRLFQHPECEPPRYIEMSECSEGR